MKKIIILLLALLMSACSAVKPSETLSSMQTESTAETTVADPCACKTYGERIRADLRTPPTGRLPCARYEHNAGDRKKSHGRRSHHHDGGQQSAKRAYPAKRKGVRVQDENGGIEASRENFGPTWSEVDR